ncbi:MAG: hypothetical protein DRP94_01265 [Candidatus Latescibacterota bacterium]|nr:MAG: hypothetical protein DRP94_01265 [Candidatus Latescibacterota bacterium]RKY74491.1 MAG: hypothetical protein DRQ14_01860 [Candidatus Latescibacterota bacterium]HDH99710.1 hypothetical protein [Bacillota bacterium]
MSRLIQIWEVISYVAVTLIALSCIGPTIKLYRGCMGFKCIGVWKVLAWMVVALIISSSLCSVEVILKDLPAQPPWELASWLVRTMRAWVYIAVSVLAVLFMIFLKKFRRVSCSEEA